MIVQGDYVVVYFFFFKQKTAYEMRISDWSSDVCSSDLTAEVVLLSEIPGAVVHGVLRVDLEGVELIPGAGIVDVAGGLAVGEGEGPVERCRSDREGLQHLRRRGAGYISSEEHTYELQPPMRISYAVFGC